MSSSDTFAALRAVSTCNVCDALELIEGVPTVGILRGISRVNRIYRVMVGFACTATFRSAAAKPERVINQQLELQLELLHALPGPGIIVFQDLDVPWFGATGGEIRCRFYKLGGADGVVTSGAIRDLDGLDDFEMPVYSAGVTCSHGYHYVPDLNVPVMVGGMTILPGDIIHGDRNGIIVIPSSIVDMVADISLRISKLEEDLLRVLQSADVSINVALEARKTYKSGISDIRKVVQVRK